MTKRRLEGFSDAFFPIILTIMVLELKAPEHGDWASLRSLWPEFLSYLLSFVYVAIYWNNHHHMLHVVTRVDGRVLWLNMNLLFCLSLVPFTTHWMGSNGFAPLPVAIYGVVLLACAVAYTTLQRSIIALEGPRSRLEQAVGRDAKGKVSLLLYVLAIPLAFAWAWLAGALYLAVALVWFIPDRRIERLND